jgi:transposase
VKITIDKDEYDKLLALKSEVFFLRKALFASRSEKFKKEKQPEEIDLWDECPQDSPSKTEQEKESISYKRKKRSKDQNRTKLPDHLERIEQIIEIPEEECTCDKCQEKLKVIGEDVSEELEYVPAKLIVKKIIRKKYVCPNDSLHGVYRARLPKRIIPKGIAGPQLLGQILISKYVDHLPLERQEQIFKRLGCRVPKSSMADWLKVVRQKLDPLLECLKNKMLDSRMLNCDETTFKVQQNSKKGSKINGYLWSYIGDKKWVWFDWQPSRARVGPMGVLEGFSGEYLQSDGFSAYDYVVDELGLEHLACWAHARRKFVEAFEIGSKQAEPIVELIAQLYRVEKQIRESKLSAKEAKTLRQEESVAILAELKKEIKELSHTAVPKGPLGKACQYTLKRFGELSMYCEDGELEIDNNIVERSIRPVAIGRKNWLFAGSAEGAKWAAGFYSLIETCKLHKINPAEYLTAVLQYLGDYEGEDMTTLLPDAYSYRVNAGEA